MSEALPLVLAAVAGAALGAVFFGGLWWTIQKVVADEWPALLLSVSLLVRASVTLVGFYLVAAGRWERMVACLLGFVLARLVVTRLPRWPEEPRARSAREGRHAP